MRVPLEWLAEYCDPRLDVRDLGERLAMTGTEVDRILHHGVGNLDAFVVGRVIETVRHPDADRLTVCRVRIADGVETQIVCGAPNVAAGQMVAIARPGAVMPDGTKLKKAKLRGVASDGMILAEDELAISSDHDETIVLDPAGLVVGQPLAGVLPIATEVLELEITPNRPDCLGVYGVAREVHAATGAQLARPPWEDDPGSFAGDVGVEVVVEAPDLCPRFTARAFEDVTIAPSPPWLKARLMAAGQRPINNVVDITNYVMLLTGQPLHAFDLDRIAGARLVVRRAGDGEEVVTLDGQTRVLDPDVCLIADADGPTSIAGVMGGTRSEVQPSTERVLMEVASWDGPSIHDTSLKLGLRSEASGRFEKGLSVEQTLEALAVATRLMLELTGARLVPGTIDVGGAGPDPLVIGLRDARVSGLLGVQIERAESALHLQRLGFETRDRPDTRSPGDSQGTGGLDVTVPHWRRNDVSREADLIEEVARLHGVNDQLPATLPSRRGAVGVLTAPQRLRRRAEDALAGRGLLEIVGWSFESPDLDDRLRLPAGDPRRARVAIENPMSAEQSVLRTTLLGSLLAAASHNAARGQGIPGIFESGAVYLRGDETLPHEHRALGALVPGDVFAAKGYLEGLLRALRVDATFRAKGQVEAVVAAGVDAALVAGSEPFLHPGRSADVVVGESVVGWVGDVHPLVAAAWDLDDVAAFEIDLDAVVATVEPVARYEDLTSFPELREDIAVVVDAGVPAAAVLQAVRAAGGKLLARAEVFDVYRGEQVAAGRTSLAIALTFRARDRTLADADVAPVREKIVARLAKDLGGELRG
ncbi:MAG TPA: phenylalanine--tRNA ligase subunit beta [Solirubrobacteraceae bacterium]|jgi:phenylalanyl-tRNA synthetase beta chain|nr:phenylalanine--tRNA ligase subunit beta [Solirubrobacteraceae bacterium]